MEPTNTPNDPLNTQQPQPSVTPGQQQPAPQFPQYGGGAPAQQSPTPTSFSAAQPAKKGPNMRLIIIILGVVVVLVVITVIAFMMNKKSNTNSNQSASSSSSSSYAAGEDTAFNSLKQAGSSLSASSLGAIDKTNLFYAVFRNAAEQSTIVTTKNFYETTDLNSAPLVSGESRINGFTQPGYDYANNQFSYASDVSDINDICVNGTDYFLSSIDPSGGWAKSPNGNGNCQVSSTDTTINDGFNTGGLTTTQAQTFVDTLRNMQGLITVKGASIATVQGKSYLRFDVTVNQVSCGATFKAMGCFQHAFSGLGLPSSHPFQLDSSLISGSEFAYFVSPATQLPTYTQVAYTPVSGSQYNWSNQQIVYSFGSLPTYSTSSKSAPSLSISWPVQTLSQ